MNRESNRVPNTAIAHDLALALHLAFHRLERAQILGHAATGQQTRIHWRMFRLAEKQHSPREIWGEIVWIFGASIKTPIGVYP